jgi:hypothetical protein
LPFDPAADRVAVGDVNGDGMADIVVLDTTTGQAEILLKTSAGAYTPGKPPPPGARGDSVDDRLNALAGLPCPSVLSKGKMAVIQAKDDSEEVGRVVFCRKHSDSMR